MVVAGVSISISAFSAGSTRHSALIRLGRGRSKQPRPKRRRLFQCSRSGESAVIPVVSVHTIVAVREQLATIDREQPDAIAGDSGVASHDGGRVAACY